MTRIDDAADVIGRYVHDDFARDAAIALATVGLIAPDPQIIRTPAELEALDPDSIVLDRSGHLLTHRDRLPAVVIASGAQVRAARQALEGETT